MIEVKKKHTYGPRDVHNISWASCFGPLCCSSSPYPIPSSSLLIDQISKSFVSKVKDDMEKTIHLAQDMSTMLTVLGLFISSFWQ